MIKNIFISILLISLSKPSFTQSVPQIDSLLSIIGTTENSKDITKNPAVLKLISYGDKMLPNLLNYFVDSNQTQIKSDCMGEFLNKGEIAIIIADRIEIMPYATLTGVQNCLLTFCENNPNWIEYYLLSIRRNGVNQFKQKYSDWLTSCDRKKWTPYLNNKKLQKGS